MKDKDASKISTKKRFGGDYIEKYLYNGNIKEYNSYIKYFTKDGICKSVKYYSDKEFKHLYSTETRKYNPDGSYFAVTQYKEPMQGKILSAEGSFDKEERLIDAKLYFDKNRKKLFGSSRCKYNPDGSYVRTWIYEQPNKNGDLSIIENYDKDDKYISGKYYTDKNFSNLRLTETREYNPDGSYIGTWIYEQPDEYGDLSAITNYDKDNRYIGGKYYTDKNFSKLRLTITREYNSDGSYSKTWIYEQPDEYGDLSAITNYDKDNRYIGGKYYTDKNFSKLRLTITREYNSDGSYSKTWIYEQPNKNGTLSFIENYDKNDKYISGKYYTDKNFSNLRLTETREYNPDGSYIETGIYEQPNENGNLSAITYNDKDKQCIYAISYKDKSFSVINRISLWKHTNEWSYCLRIYPNDDKTSCNADIEKYEKNSPNMIYKKPCNFKGNLEEINRLLSEFFNN